MKKVLNLYAGLGGNRKLWTNVEVTAVELDPKIAATYLSFYPEDVVLVQDAHEYLLHHYDEYDFIWSSPPCQTHSKMMKATRHKKKRYVDLSLYQEILLLQHFFKGKYVVENVIPFYTPLIPGQKLGRHMYWANFNIGDYVEPSPKNFINLDTSKEKQILMDWLDIHYEENIYYGNNHCPCQILRNCVHPKEGLAIFERAFENI